MKNYLTKIEFENISDYFNGSSYLNRYYTYDEFKTLIKDSIKTSDCANFTYKLNQTLNELAKHKENNIYIYVEDWGIPHNYDISYYATVDTDESTYDEIWKNMNKKDEYTELLEMYIGDIIYKLEYNHIVDKIVVGASKFDENNDFYKEWSFKHNELNYKDSLDLIRKMHNELELKQPLITNKMHNMT